MKITWKKVTAAVVAFFGIGALTACYGMPPHEDEDNPYLVYGKVKTVNQKGETLSVEKVNVSVTLGTTKYTAVTNSDGFYEIHLPEACTKANVFVVFEDRAGVLKNDTSEVSITPGTKGEMVDVIMKAE